MKYFINGKVVKATSNHPSLKQCPMCGKKRKARQLQDKYKRYPTDLFLYQCTKCLGVWKLTSQGTDIVWESPGLAAQAAPSRREAP